MNFLEERILKDGIIIKNTDAVETLGKTDILCCDKTGILTHNKMNVVKIFDGDKLCSFDEYNPDEKILSVLKLATACTTLQNDSTEYAIEKACLTYNSMSLEDIEHIFPKISFKIAVIDNPLTLCAPQSAEISLGCLPHNFSVYFSKNILYNVFPKRLI